MPYATNPTDGVRSYYEIEGSGSPLVLFPGTTGTIVVHHEYGWVDELVDGYQLLLVDSRGQGKSDKPHDLNAYSWDILASDVIAVLDHAGVERAHIAGYSTGGLIAFRVAANYPNRVISIVAGGAQPFATTEEVREEITGFIALLRQVGIEELIEVWEREAGEPLLPGWRADLEVCDVEALIGICQAEIDEPGLSDEQVRGIEIPALIYSGDDDEATAGTIARRAAEMMPAATYVELVHTNHWTAATKSDVILPRIREFLDQVEVERRS